jgi:hypothetical protein
LITGAHGGDPAVKVTGMGGISKSLLAQEYALRFAAAYPGGVFWLRAHGHDDHDDIVADTERDGDRDNQLLAFATELGIPLGSRRTSCARPSRSGWIGKLSGSCGSSTMCLASLTALRWSAGTPRGAAAGRC